MSTAQKLPASPLLGVCSAEVTAANDPHFAHRAEIRFIDQLPVPSMLLARDGKIIHASSAAARLLNIDPTKPSEKMPAILEFEQNHGLLKIALSDCSSGSGPVSLRLYGPHSVDGVVETSKGLELKLSMNAQPGNPGADVTFLATVETITVEPAAKAEPAPAASGNDPAPSGWLSVVSHEFRTPLNAIIGFAQLLQSGLPEFSTEAKRQEYSGLILDSAQDLLELTNAMLDMSKIAAGRFQVIREPVNLTDVLKACIARLEPVAQASGVTLAFHAPQFDATLDADPRALRQIVINLVANAIKFSSEGEAVTLAVQRHAGAIKFSVSDTGIGMTKDELERLGEVFYQADSGLDRNYEGTGLGMSIVMGLVKLHEGTVETRSESGKGTCVTISLPAPDTMPRPVPADPGAEIVFLNKNAPCRDHTTQANLARKIR